jgi:hypothetical protein
MPDIGKLFIHCHRHWLQFSSLPHFRVTPWLVLSQSHEVRVFYFGVLISYMNIATGIIWQHLENSSG